MFGGLSNWAKAVNGAKGAGKAVLYRFGAYNVWVFVGLSLLIWALEYYNLNELQEWCARSSFKRDRFLTKKREYFFDYEEEHKELLKALKKTFATTKEGGV